MTTTYEGDPAPPGAPDVRYRVRWEPAWRPYDDPEEVESAGWVVESGRLARVHGQLVRGWTQIGMFTDWRDAMEEATKDPAYGSPKWADVLHWQTREELRRVFHVDLWAHEATWVPLRVPPGSPPAWRCSQQWPDEEPCYTATVNPWSRQVCHRAVLVGRRAVPGQ